MRTRKTHFSQSPAAIAAVLAVLVLGVAAAVVLGRPDSSDTPGSPTAADGTDGADPSSVRIVLDGWSAAILDDEPQLRRGETVTDLEWRPMTAADIENLLASHPDAVEQLVARTVTSDPSLSCDADGCRTDDGDVPVSTLLDPATAPAPLGDIYAAWGVGAPIVADVDVVDTAALSLTADGWDTAPFYELASGDGELLVVGAGFGELFPLRAQWLVDGARDTIRPQLASTTTAFAGDVPALGGGPAQPTVRAALLTPSQLTALSSPTTGCGPAMFCAPRPVAVSFDVESASAFLRADSRSLDAAGQPVTAVFVAMAGTIHGTLEHPVPAMAGRTIAAGEAAERFAIVEMYDANGLVALAGRQGDAPEVWTETDAAAYLGSRFIAVDGDATVATGVPETTPPVPSTTVPPRRTAGEGEIVVVGPDVPVGPGDPTDPNNLPPGVLDPGMPVEVPPPPGTHPGSLVG